MTNYEIADEVAKDYTLSLTGKDPELAKLLREAIVKGIERKLAKIEITQVEIDGLERSLNSVRRIPGTDKYSCDYNFLVLLVLLGKVAELKGFYLRWTTMIDQMMADGAANG